MIQGNLIGTDVTGTLPLGNDRALRRHLPAGPEHDVGGPSPGEGNVIAFNAGDA